MAETAHTPGPAGKFCDARQAIPKHGYCNLAGCPNAIIAGHKTMQDGSRVPIRRFEADEIFAAIEARDKRLAEEMPDEQAALLVMCAAHERLRKLGWADAIYCPKDGSLFDVIEAGSTGVQTAHYDGAWPKGTWWVHGDGDLWPSRPILWRAKAVIAKAEGRSTLPEGTD